MKKLIAIMTVLVFALAACGGDSGGDGGSEATDAPSNGLTGDAAAGEDVYKSTCASCHGPDATGIDGLGKDLHNNAFVDERSDSEMVAFLKEGRPAGDPANDTGVDMPPKE